MTKVIDLHCDLLGCIEHDPKKLHFEHPDTRCSILQLEAGNVKLQTLAIGALNGKGSSLVGNRQFELYQQLLQKYPDRVGSFSTFTPSSKKLHVMLAIENLVALVEDSESLECVFTRLDQYRSQEKVLYVSLTWNQENRFGGGNLSKVGLKRDGELFLEYLHEKDTAVDLSHTSDYLANDILEHIDKKSLKVRVIASHSNFREVKQDLRNLPDTIAKEIVARGGLIGINFVRRFVGDHRLDFCKHIEKGISLGGENTLCLGADFYGGLNIPKKLIPNLSYPTFQQEFDSAACYPQFVTFLASHFDKSQVQKIASKNVENFLGL